MKKLLAISFLILALNTSSRAQLNEDEVRHKFKKERIFVGTSLGLGIGGNVFNVGADPEVGYSITNWLDAGISTNINYTSIRAEVNDGLRQRSSVYGVGAFVRIFPLRSFFVQLLPEYNWLQTNIKDERFGSTGTTYKFKQEAPSLLAGIGYGGRIIGQSGFFTVLMIDLGNNAVSPYIDSYGAKLPVLRAGFNVYLGPKRRR